MKMALRFSFFVFIMAIAFSTSARADCYKVHSQSGWEIKCGNVPSPDVKYAIPTVDRSLNQNDKSYLCSLIQISEAQCSNLQFSTGSSGISAENGIIKYGIDVRMELMQKQCSATVWKTRQNDNTWILSSPTSILLYCDFP